MAFPRAWLIAITALVALVGLQINLPNLGNNLIPRNFVAWAGLVLSATGVMAWRLRQGSMRWPRLGVLWLVPPIAVLVHAFWVPATIGHYPLTAAGMLLGFAFWIWALGQVDFEARDWYALAKLIWVGVVVLVVLALPTPNYLNVPSLLDNLWLVLRLPEGGFQQRNVFASFVAAALIWVWLLRLKVAPDSTALGRFGFYFSVFLCACVVWFSGSRTGSVALVISFAGAAFYGWRRGAARRELVWAVVAVAAAFLLSVYSPFGDLNERIADLQSGSSTRARLSMWQVSAAVGANSPWFGHGLGSFTAAFHPEFVRQVLAGETLSYVNFLNHPHNETLLWWVETGAYGLVFVILPWVIALAAIGLWRNPLWLPFGLTLLPIAMHTQTEFPLHASGAHWWLAGLIVASFAPSSAWTTHALNARRAWSGLVVVLGGSVTLLLLHAGWVSYLAWQNGKRVSPSAAAYVEARQQDPELNHWALGSQSTDFWVLSLMRLGLQEGNLPLVRQLLPELQAMQVRWQGPQVWTTLALAYRGLGEDELLAAHMAWVAALSRSHADRLQANLERLNSDASPDL